MSASAVNFPQVSVIIPAFREVENLSLLIPRVARELHNAGYIAEILVVDDASGDGTTELCADFADEYRVRLIVREGERGLARAVICGMKEARGDIFVVMDADLSHPPERVPDLVSGLDEDEDEVDMVIGSRYVDEGSTDEAWGTFRKFNSWVASIMARPLVKVSDPMAGFFAIRSKTLEEGDSLNPLGYKIALELMLKCRCQRIKEIPIHFRTRTYGTSKLTFREQLKYFLHVIRLMDYKYEKWTCFIKFCLVGATGMVVDLLFLSVFLFFLPFFVSRALAIWVAMSWNFMLNRRFTFSYAQDGRMPRQYVMFCGSCAVGGVLNWAVSVCLSYTVGFMGEHPLLSAVAGIVVGTGFNYLINRKVTFTISHRES